MKQTDERIYNASSQMLRRTLTQWSTVTPGGSSQPRDPHVTKNVNLILDTGGNALAAASTMQYDADLNAISTSSYDYASVNATTAQTGAIGSIPLGTLVRTEETTYLVNDTSISSGVRQTYRDRQLLGLPSSSRVKNAAGSVVAQSEIKYDEAAYPLLTYGTVTGWTDPATSVRGLPTTSRSWLNTNGSWLETHAQYDQCGSPRKSWDALGKVSEVTYSTTYHFDHLSKASNLPPRRKHSYRTGSDSDRVVALKSALLLILRPLSTIALSVTNDLIWWFYVRTLLL